MIEQLFENGQLWVGLYFLLFGQLAYFLLVHTNDRKNESVYDYALKYQGFAHIIVSIPLFMVGAIYKISQINVGSMVVPGWVFITLGAIIPSLAIIGISVYSIKLVEMKENKPKPAPVPSKS